MSVCVWGMHVCVCEHVCAYMYFVQLDNFIR